MIVDVFRSCNNLLEKLSILIFTSLTFKCGFNYFISNTLTNQVSVRFLYLGGPRWENILKLYVQIDEGTFYFMDILEEKKLLYVLRLSLLILLYYVCR